MQRDEPGADFFARRTDVTPFQNADCTRLATKRAGPAERASARKYHPGVKNVLRSGQHGQALSDLRSEAVSVRRSSSRTVAGTSPRSNSLYARVALA